MASADEVELLPDAEQHKLLTATLERVNRASNAARAAGLQAQAFSGAPLREIVNDEIERAKLPDGFVTPAMERVERSLQRRAGKQQQKFSPSRDPAMPRAPFKWNTPEGVTLLAGWARRAIKVRADMSRGDLPPPLAGRPVMLLLRNGEF